MFNGLIGVRETARFNLSFNQCAVNMQLRKDFMIVSCPRFGVLQGQVQLYFRNGTHVQLILNEIGNSTAIKLDYFNIGASIDIMEHNANHSTLFYTSTLLRFGYNVTHINTVQIFIINGS